MKIEDLVRRNILKMKPYSSARHEFSGSARVFLDANENPFDTGLNRYPDPNATAVKEKIAELKGVAVDQIFLGNGSDEAIDLLIRAFCEPGKDKIAQLTPTYGMYRVSAELNDVRVISIDLNQEFQIDLERTLATLKEQQPKILFACSPNNPTGNTLEKEAITQLLQSFDGILVLDEAYIDFSEQPSLLPELNRYPNLVILQTFSKAWGMAGIRLGAAYSSKEITAVLQRIKPPYNVNTLTQKAALETLQNVEKVRGFIRRILEERESLKNFLGGLRFVKKLYPTSANFILAEFEDAKKVMQNLSGKGVIVRDRSSQVANTLRITVGTREENELLKELLNEMEEK